MAAKNITCQSSPSELYLNYEEEKKYTQNQFNLAILLFYFI